MRDSSASPRETTSSPSREVREPGSFRDPESQVFYLDGEVVRALSSDALQDWEALSRSSLFERFAGAGRLIGTERLDAADVPDAARNGWAAFLRHERVPFVSYPYEWPFGMLRDAALLQLELLVAGLDEGLILKDASPYNVQWRGTEPVFIDVGSFERLREGEPWAGYRQFCMLCLYPLMLEALRGVAFQPWLRGSIDGIAPEAMWRLLSRRHLFRRGVLTHVYLHARLERRYADRRRDVSEELRSAGFKKELIAANARGLQRVVSGLEPRPAPSAWSEYGERAHYTDADRAAKEAFVARCAASRHWRLAWDLGCNDGAFSRIVAEHADSVVAVDGDPAVVDALYRRLRADGDAKILPLVNDLADPSPGLGWRGRERKALEGRGPPDLTLALALVHHLAITRNVPLLEILDWLAELGTSLVVELPLPDDPMTRRLLAAKRDDLHRDYNREHFERLLGERFALERTEELPSGTRVLYFARPR